MPETVTLRNGRTLTVHPLSREDFAACLAMAAAHLMGEAPDGVQALDIMRRVVPDATPADLALLAQHPGDVAAIMRTAAIRRGPMPPTPPLES